MLTECVLVVVGSETRSSQGHGLSICFAPHSYDRINYAYACALWKLTFSSSPFSLFSLFHSLACISYFISCIFLTTNKAHVMHFFSSYLIISCMVHHISSRYNPLLTKREIRIGLLDYSNSWARIQQSLLAKGKKRKRITQRTMTTTTWVRSNFKFKDTIPIYSKLFGSWSISSCCLEKVWNCVDDRYRAFNIGSLFEVWKVLYIKPTSSIQIMRL